MFLLAVFSPAVFATDITAMPPALRGDIHVGYSGDFGFVGLEEGSAYVGRADLFRHDMLFGGEFAPIRGLAINLQVPYTPSWSLKWLEARKMAYDPVQNTGSYATGETINDPPKLTASGTDGVWIGLAFAPFSASYGKGLLKQNVDWRLGLQYRTGGGSTLWSAPDGHRGVAPGGSAWRLTAAFSTRRGDSCPYLGLDAVFEGKPVVLDIVDESGTTWATGLPIDAASHVDVRAGVEITDQEIAETGYRFAWDLYMGFGYTTWQDIPSGIFLPSVLDASRTIAVTEGDYVHGKAGMAAIVDINKYAGMRIGVEGGYKMPHTVENVYPIRWSADSFDVVANVSFEGRIR